MRKIEQLPVVRPETEEEKGYRKSKEVLEIFQEAQHKGDNPPKPKEHGLDYYDNRRENKEGGKDTHHEGRYGKFEDDDE